MLNIIKKVFRNRISEKKAILFAREGSIKGVNGLIVGSYISDLAKHVSSFYPHNDCAPAACLSVICINCKHVTDVEEESMIVKGLSLGGVN